MNIEVSPERIYLDPPDEYGYQRCWSGDRRSEDDVEYIRVDVARQIMEGHGDFRELCGKVHGALGGRA